MIQELFSKDAYGNVLSWKISIVNKQSSCSLCIVHGRYDGDKTMQWEHDIVGVNIGKSNETTPLEQAQSRLESRVNKKQRGGYKTLPEEQLIELKNINMEAQISLLKEALPDISTDKEGHSKPMKAVLYFRSKKNWTDPYGKLWKDRKYFYLQNPHEPKEEGAVIPKFPVYGQPKYNGVRSTIRLEFGEPVIRSKDGLIYDLPHIKQWAVHTFNNMEDASDLVFDGELFIYGESLQNIRSAVVKPNLNTSRVIFVCYDLAIAGYTNKERWQMLKEANADGVFMHPAVELTRTYIIKSDEQAQRMCDKFINDEGHEGIMLRDMDAPYHFGKKRINMTKLKRTISHEFKIVRVEPQPKEPQFSLFICQHKSNTFKVTPTFDDTTKEHILKDKHLYIGKLLQCTFYEWTDKDIPFHIIETTIRDYE